MGEQRRAKVNSLILGATGNVGPHVVSELAAVGERPRVLVRDGDRARTVLGDTAEILTGDATDPPTLAAAANGVDTVFLLSPHSISMADMQLGIIRNLRRTGARIIKLSGTSSSITPDGPYACREHWEIERVLQESGQPFVILRPNSFMQVIIGKQMIPALKSTGKVLNPIGSAGLSLIDVRDVGAVAAKVVISHDWDGQTLVLTGPRAVGYAEIAALVAERTSHPTAVIDMSPADLRASLRAKGTEEWEADHFQEMYELFRAGESAFVTDTVERVSGSAPRTIEAYLDEALPPQAVTS